MSSLCSAAVRNPYSQPSNYIILPFYRHVLPSGGEFVETIKKLPARTKFGPLVGVRTAEKSTDAHVQAPFVWKVRHLFYIDAV